MTGSDQGSRGMGVPHRRHGIRGCVEDGWCVLGRLILRLGTAPSASPRVSEGQETVVNTSWCGLVPAGKRKGQRRGENKGRVGGDHSKSLPV